MCTHFILVRKNDNKKASPTIKSRFSTGSFFYHLFCLSFHKLETDFIFHLRFIFDTFECKRSRPTMHLIHVPENFVFKARDM